MNVRDAGNRAAKALVDSLNGGDRAWKKYLLNAEESLGEFEKTRWREIEVILRELFTELKGNDKIEIVYPPIASKHLVNIVLNRNQITANLNMLMKITDSYEVASDFFERTQKFGFTENAFGHMLAEFAVLSLITDTECFKSILLFQLKNVDHRVSNFNSTMARWAPQTWQKLKPFMYNKFRNALAHGTWTIERNYVVLFEDAKLIPFERIHLAEFLITFREKSLLCECLGGVVQDLIDEKFFE